MTTVRIVTPCTAESTAIQVMAGSDLSGRRAIVTGAASGIGIETARALARAGAEVTIAVRNLEAGTRAAEDIADTTGNARVVAATLDLSDRASVASFVAAWDGPLHMLVNNAGVMASPEMRTPEGWELQFATNHFGHFALAVGLHHALCAARSARVVSVSSGGHLLSPVVFEDTHFRIRPYDPWLAYGQSKTANALFELLELNARARADDRYEMNHPSTRAASAAPGLMALVRASRARTTATMSDWPCPRATVSSYSARDASRSGVATAAVLAASATS
jgi:NAD(P)-dependent dehydrogenase (short-subunit alcohol dehydrogenase family)